VEGSGVELHGTSALVTGGSSGLGLAAARALAECGTHVVLLSRRAEHGEAAAADVGATHVAGDVRVEGDVLTALVAARNNGPLRSVVLCAAIGHAERTVHRAVPGGAPHGIDTFRGGVETNLVGSFNCLRLAAAQMSLDPPDALGRRGSFVLTSSLAARGGQAGQAAYAASKAGLHGLLHPVACDLSPLGMRINLISPGGFDTPMYGPHGVPDDLRQKLSDAATFPHRMGRPEEFASLVLELLTNDYLNGASIDLDAATASLPH